LRGWTAAVAASVASPWVDPFYADAVVTEGLDWLVCGVSMPFVVGALIGDAIGGSGGWQW
jgi:hypothetical protein